MANYKVVDADQLDAAMSATADSIRAKTGGTDPVVWDLDNGFKSVVEGISTGSDLPNAEESAFGVSEESEVSEYGLTTTNGGSNAALSNYTVGYRFTANEAFAIVGLRGYGSYISPTVKLYNNNGGLVVSKAIPAGTDLWVEGELDEPINVSVGETYTVAAQYGTVRQISKNYVTFNEKLSDVTSVMKSGNAFPDVTQSYVFFADIIIAPISEELPDEYKIQRTTMDDIAEEVQRILGQETKMSTSQIESGLHGVVLQEKTVTPTDSEQEITPDEGYYGLSKVLVSAAESGSALPDNARLYYVGSAESVLDTNAIQFESSAVGELIE